MSLQAGLLSLSQSIFPRCPAPRTASGSLPATSVGAALCKAHSALQNLREHGHLMTSTSVSAGLPGSFFLPGGRSRGKGEPHIITVIRNMSPCARVGEDGSSTRTTTTTPPPPPRNWLKLDFPDRQSMETAWGPCGARGAWKGLKPSCCWEGPAPFLQDYVSVFRGHLYSSLVCSLLWANFAI